jgi:8-oxo-dGTP pyrophosphatase MutT (NUDIX family)
VAAGSALHRSCVRELSSWRPPSSDQDQLRDRYLAHLVDHENGWARDCFGEHLTASALIVSPERDQVLLTLHRRIGRWLQTGGHIEPDDLDLRAAALREAIEESGLGRIELGEILLLSRHVVPCGPIRPCFHLDVQFLAIADPGQQPAISDESDDVRWFGVDRLPDVDESVGQLVASARSRPDAG